MKAKMPSDLRTMYYQSTNGGAGLTARQMKRVRQKAKHKWIGPL